LAHIVFRNYQVFKFDNFYTELKIVLSKYIFHLFSSSNSILRIRIKRTILLKYQ